MGRMLRGRKYLGTAGGVGERQGVSREISEGKPGDPGTELG